MQTETKTAEQGGGGMVAVPPGSTTTTCTERQRVDWSLRKAPPETMPTLVALQRSPALPPIGPPPPYPRKTNTTPSLNPPAILAIHPQAPFGDAVSPLVDGDGSSVSLTTWRMTVGTCNRMNTSVQRILQWGRGRKQTYSMMNQQQRSAVLQIKYETMGCE
jgi:hypothetical protein